MDATDRALSWIRRDWIFELTKIPGNTVEEAEKLAIKLIQNSYLAHDIWIARCAAIRDRPEGDPVERRQATTQYEAELRRTRRTAMPVSLEQFLNKSWHQRQRLLRGWINLPSVEVTALRNWVNSIPRPPPPPAPQQTPAPPLNPPTLTNSVPPTPTTTRITINKTLPRTTAPGNHKITAFFKRAPQASAPRRPPPQPNLPPSPPAIPRNRPTQPACKRKAPPTMPPSTEPKKRIKETYKEAQTRRSRRAEREYDQSTNHGKSINLQIMTQTPPRQRAPRQTNGQPRTKLAVGEQVPPTVQTKGVDVDVA